MLGIIPIPPPEALNSTHNLGNPHPRLANKKGHFGDTWVNQDPLKIRGNYGKPTTLWGCPISNPNRS